MEVLNSKTLEKLVKDGISQKKPVIKGKNFTVVKDCVLDRNRFNVIVFAGKKFALEEVSAKNRYIDLDKYLLTIASETEHTKNLMDFANAQLYSTTQGELYKCDLAGLGQIYAGGLVVLNNSLLVLCSERMPRFYAVIAKDLVEIPADRVENIIRFQRLSDPQKLSLLSYYLHEQWEIHNGIIINPQTLSVPSPLHFDVWKRRRNSSKANIGKPLEVEILAKMLTRTETDKPGAKYISI